jgi:hypothetical protein
MLLEEIKRNLEIRKTALALRSLEGMGRNLPFQTVDDSHEDAELRFLDREVEALQSDKEVYEVFPPFEGFAVSTDQARAFHPEVQAILDAMPEQPRIRAWNHTRGGVQIHTQNMIYIPTVEAHAARPNRCLCGHCPKPAPELYYDKVLLHEVAHWTGKALQRETYEQALARGGRPAYERRQAMEEITAESTAMRLMEHAGVASDELHRESEEYVSKFEERGNVQRAEVAADIRAAVNMILGRKPVETVRF